MHVSVNGVRLFFDVEGSKFVPDGPVMREKPTLLMLHGGPGSDHSIYRPAYSALSDIVQVIYLDHRGNGRSGDGPRESWNLVQWGDDVRAFCEALGIVDPIVLGASFGGMVALAYATRHPEHPAKLVLISTEAVGGSYPERRVELFERFGGAEVGALARRRFLEIRSHPDQASLEAWRRLAVPLYTRVPRDPDAARRASAGRKCCYGSAGPAERAAASTCWRTCTTSDARHWCWAAKTTPFTRSKARPILPPRCPRISCSSSGSKLAGTPSFPTRPNARSR
jgi:pimeloyl-ACP methyl ester carboxylesterase